MAGKVCGSLFLSKLGTSFPPRFLFFSLGHRHCALGSGSHLIKLFISNFCRCTTGCRIRGALCCAKKASAASSLVLFAWCKSQVANEIRNFVTMLIILINDGGRPLHLQSYRAEVGQLSTE